MPSLTSSMRRDSTSTVSSSTTSVPSVTVNSSTPAFRALRSLLPFAPGKQPTAISPSVSSTDNSVSNVFKNSFAASFASVRRKSISKDRKASVTQESPPVPVISIGRENRTEDEPPLRRSFSYPEFEKPVTKAESLPVPDDETKSLGSSQRTVQGARTPSPLISAADLSTILEADTSRDLLSAASSRATSMSPAIPSSQLGGHELFGSSPTDPQDSFLHFSPGFGQHTDLDDDDYHFSRDLPSTGTILIHSAENSQHLFRPDRTINARAQRDSANSFNLDALDPDLRALLSPNKCDPSQERRGSSATTSGVPTVNSSPTSQYFTPTLAYTEITPPRNKEKFSASQTSLPRPKGSNRESLLPRLRPTHRPNTSGSSASTPNSPVTPTFRANGSTTSLTHSSRIEATPLAKANNKRDNLMRNSHSRSVSTSGTPATRKFTPQTQRKVSQVANDDGGRRASISGIPRLSSPFRPQLQRSTTATTRATAVPNSPVSSEFGERSRRSTATSQPRPGAGPLSVNTREATSRPSIDSTRSEILHPRDNEWTITPRSQQQVRAPAMSRSVSGGHRRERSLTSSTVDSRGRYSVRTDEGPQAIERSSSVQEQYRQLGHGRRGPSRASSRSRGEDEELTSPVVRALRSPNYDGDGGRRATSSLSGRLSSSSGRAKTDWLGPRTIKAFQAAGLMGERDQEERFSPGSMPDGHFRTLGSIKGSESGQRSPSRAAFSESAESGGRRSNYNYNLQASPTHTASSGSGRDRERERLQDTPKSASTAPTSISGWNRAEPPEIQELKDRHALETGALLSALSDSQRVARVLRTENDELRGRLDRIDVLERENIALKEEVADLEAQLGLYKREVSMLLARARENQPKPVVNTWNAPRQRSGLGTTSPIAGVMSDEEEQDTFEDDDTQHTQTLKTPIKAHKLESPIGKVASPDFALELSSGEVNNSNPLLNGKLPPPNFSSTPPPPTSTQKTPQRRRLSTTSSVFPIPPANMSMLLHDQGPGGYDSEQESVFSNSSNPLVTSTPPMPIARSTPQRRDDSRMASISPSSASFSMFTRTGSPSTLSLRPEHELHLGDLESLDLGIRTGDDSEDLDEINISQLLRN